MTHLSRGFQCDVNGCSQPWNEGTEHSFDNGDSWVKLCVEHESKLVDPARALSEKRDPA